MNFFNTFKLVKELKLTFNPFYVNYNKYSFKWFYEQRKGVFLNYIEKKALQVAEEEGVKVFFVSFKDLNKGKDSEAVGKFFYYDKKEWKEEYKSEIKKRFGNISINNIPRKDVVPRIEISELGDVFTVLHELGHYFLYKRQQPQSEKAADMYIEEFFDNHLPPFFKWIYQIDISIRTNKEYNFSPKESYKHWIEYKEFTKNFSTYKL